MSIRERPREPRAWETARKIAHCWHSLCVGEKLRATDVLCMPPKDWILRNFQDDKIVAHTMSSGISFYFETFASERFNQTPCKLMARKALKWNVAIKALSHSLLPLLPHDEWSCITGRREREPEQEEESASLFSEAAEKVYLRSSPNNLSGLSHIGEAFRSCVRAFISGLSCVTVVESIFFAFRSKVQSEGKNLKNAKMK